MGRREDFGFFFLLVEYDSIKLIPFAFVVHTISILLHFHAMPCHAIPSRPIPSTVVDLYFLGLWLRYIPYIPYENT